MPEPCVLLGATRHTKDTVILLLLGIALPLAILGFGIDSGDEEEALDEVTLEGSEDADRLEGDEGRDFIDGLAGDDVMNGRAGQRR